jgi:hypothetical protein
MAVFVQPQFPGNAFHDTGPLHAPGLGLAAEPLGDVGPGQALAAQVGEFSFLVGEALAKTAE